MTVMSYRHSLCLNLMVMALLVPIACAKPAPTQAPLSLEASAESAQLVSVRPGVNDGYAAGELETFIDRFESEGREVRDERDAIMAACEFELGQKVIDIGAGTGLFMPVLSKAVGERGGVTAVDIIPAFLERLEQRAKDFPNVRVVHGEATDLTLDEASHERALMIDVYHHVEYPPVFLASVMKALKPGGELIVVDFRRIEGVTSARMMAHVRASQEEVRAEIEEAGFEFLESRDWMRENYFMRFRRP